MLTEYLEKKRTAYIKYTSIYNTLQGTYTIIPTTTIKLKLVWRELFQCRDSPIWRLRYKHFKRQREHLCTSANIRVCSEEKLYDFVKISIPFVFFFTNLKRALDNSNDKAYKLQKNDNLEMIITQM